MPWAVRGLGILCDGCFLSVILWFCTEQGPYILSAPAWQGQSAPDLGFALLTLPLKGISFICLVSVYSIVSTPKKTLYTEANFESVRW